LKRASSGAFMSIAGPVLKFKIAIAALHQVACLRALARRQ
jgi:hypothetical protein